MSKPGIARVFQFSITLTLDLADRLDTEAERTGKSRSEVIRLACNEYFAKMKNEEVK
jgi:metal-responsive CopG/Arc/MetJ family transcriptional regulator